MVSLSKPATSSTAAACAVFCLFSLLRHLGGMPATFTCRPDVRCAHLQSERLNVGMRSWDGPREPVATGPTYQTNDEIMALEVRIIGEVSGESKRYEMIEKSEVVTKQEALVRAQSRGLDLILINEKSDPPLVKIANLGKYTFHEKKLRKERARDSKIPNVKNMQITYNIGVHDLDARLRQMERWMEHDRQQVRVTMVMKGRAKMFEQQSKQVLKRIQAASASFAKTMRSTNEDDGIRKTPRGDLTMTMQPGADILILKELRKAIQSVFATGDVVADATGDEEDEGNTHDDDDEIVVEILEKLKATREELLDCGVDPRLIEEQPEVQQLRRQLQKIRDDAAGYISGRHEMQGIRE